MRVMLVYPNDRMDGLIPVGTSVLSAHLKAAGHEVKLYDTTFIDTGKQTGDFYREQLGQVIPVQIEKYGVARTKMTLSELQQDFRRAVLEFNPGLVAFSTLEITYDQGLELVRAIQDIPIPKIFGGLYPTFAPRIVLREPAIDMICEGEGEEMLPELATALEKGEEISKIMNLTVKRNGKIYRSGQIVTLEDLPTGDNIYGEKIGLRRPQTHMGNTLLGSDYSIYDERRFLKKMGGKIVRAVAMELSRGCPYTCTFCCVPNQQEQLRAAQEKFSSFSGMELSLLKKADPYHRVKPIDKFVEEVKDAIEKYQINFIFITDESFLSMSPERFKEFIAKYGEVKLPFFTETRVETVKPGYAEAMESVGCTGIAMGVESGSIELRKQLLKRRMTDETIIHGFREFEKTNIRISANNIIGFPGESREDIFKTIELNRQINVDSIIVNAFRPYSGTELRKICIQRNLIPPEERAEDNRVYGAFFNGVLSAAELEGIRRCFNLYVRLPKDRWDEIRRAETDDALYWKLKQEVTEKFLLHRRAREAAEIFIVDEEAVV